MFGLTTFEVVLDLADWLAVPSDHNVLAFIIKHFYPHFNPPPPSQHIPTLARKMEKFLFLIVKNSLSSVAKYLSESEAFCVV